MTEYILEAKYDYDGEYEDEDWEQEQSYEDQEKAIEMFKAYCNVTGKGIFWRLRKVTSETICES